ncbi:hypothetical protein KAU33_12090 [Candidatus Dependentiae bacterium]|nr:hypothetical protein [Candidatus Dependentiae bacterium]
MKKLCSISLIFIILISLFGCTSGRNVNITQDEKEYLEKIKKTKNKFIIKTNEEEELRRRAQIFISKYSKLKFLIINKERIQTRGPKFYPKVYMGKDAFGNLNGKYENANGYLVTFKRIDENKIQVKVRCFGRTSSPSARKLNEKIIVYYLLTEEIRPKFITK